MIQLHVPGVVNAVTIRSETHSGSVYRQFNILAGNGPIVILDDTSGYCDFGQVSLNQFPKVQNKILLLE